MKPGWGAEILTIKAVSLILSNLYLVGNAIRIKALFRLRGGRPMTIQ